MCIRDSRIEKEERVLVTTLTKRMAEELAEYLLNNNVRCNYIHSDVDTLERVKIMEMCIRDSCYIYSLYKSLAASRSTFFSFSASIHLSDVYKSQMQDKSLKHLLNVFS